MHVQLLVARKPYGCREEVWNLRSYSHLNRWLLSCRTTGAARTRRLGVALSKEASAHRHHKCLHAGRSSHAMPAHTTQDLCIAVLAGVTLCVNTPSAGADHQLGPLVSLDRNCA